MILGGRAALGMTLAIAIMNSGCVLPPLFKDEGDHAQADDEAWRTPIHVNITVVSPPAMEWLSSALAHQANLTVEFAESCEKEIELPATEPEVIYSSRLHYAFVDAFTCNVMGGNGGDSPAARQRVETEAEEVRRRISNLSTTISELRGLPTACLPTLGAAEFMLLEGEFLLDAQIEGNSLKEQPMDASLAAIRVGRTLSRVVRAEAVVEAHAFSCTTSFDDAAGTRYISETVETVGTFPPPDINHDKMQYLAQQQWGWVLREAQNRTWTEGAFEAALNVALAARLVFAAQDVTDNGDPTASRPVESVNELWVDGWNTVESPGGAVQADYFIESHSSFTNWPMWYNYASIWEIAIAFPDLEETRTQIYGVNLHPGIATTPTPSSGLEGAPRG